MKENRVVEGLLTFLAIIALGFVLAQLKAILLPFVLALLLSYLFKPLVLFARKRRIPMAVALIVVPIIILVVGAGITMIVSSSARSFIDSFPQYEEKLLAVKVGAIETAQSIATFVGADISQYSLADAIEVSSVTALTTTGIASLISLFSDMLIIFIFLMFLLAGTGQFVAKAGIAFKGENAKRAKSVIENIDIQVRRYVITKTLINLGTGVLAGLIAWIFGLEFAVLIGFLTFLFHYIPNIGSVGSILLPLLLAILQLDSVGSIVLMMVLLAGSQFVIGNIVEPKLMEGSLNLSPLLILGSLIFWGWLWGIWGMILAVPIMSTIKIVMENVEPLRPIAVLMGGAGKETPVE